MQSTRLDAYVNTCTAEHTGMEAIYSPEDIGNWSLVSSLERQALQCCTEFRESFKGYGTCDGGVLVRLTSQNRINFNCCSFRWISSSANDLKTFDAKNFRTYKLATIPVPCSVCTRYASITVFYPLTAMSPNSLVSAMRK